MFCAEHHVIKNVRHVSIVMLAWSDIMGSYDKERVLWEIIRDEVAHEIINIMTYRPDAI